MNKARQQRKSARLVLRKVPVPPLVVTQLITSVEFDSQPERSFFEQVLRRLNVEPWEVEDIYFTGGITDPNKTDFFVEYRALDGKVRRYTPDFVIRKPERKTDYVEGRCELAVPKGKTTVAVRITDMLGEEVLVTKTV